MVLMCSLMICSDCSVLGVVIVKLGVVIEVFLKVVVGVVFGDL